MILPLAYRFGSLLVRLLVRLVRAALEVTPLLRGTPVAGGLVLLLTAILVFVLIRRRSRRKGPY